MKPKSIKSMLHELCIFVIRKSTVPEEIEKRLSSKKPPTKKHCSYMDACYQEILKKISVTDRAIKARCHKT